MESLQFELYENLGDIETLRQGEVKSYTTKEEGSMLYESRKSDHSVTVERLLWIDGWEETTGAGQAAVHKQEMTLIVLKMVVTSHDPDTRFKNVTATITFEDPSKDSTEGEPAVEAWAPFHDVERWNNTTASIKNTTRTEGNITLGYNGSQMSGGRSQEAEISWVQQDFDQGLSSAEASSRTNNRNGVTWSVMQNVQQAKGVTPEIWTAVLLSRRSKSPYLVRFRIAVRAGTVEEFINKTRRIFGTHPGETKAFSVTPWQKDICNYEGYDILKCVDRNNLGRLRHPENRADLNVRWGPKFHNRTHTTMQDIKKEEAPSPVPEVSAPKPDQGLKPDEKTDGMTTASAPNHPSVSTSTNAAETALNSSTVAASHVAVSPAVHVSGPSPLLVGWYQVPTPILPPGLETGRLAALETRMAQIEARLASQDATILQLREGLMEKTAQVARLEKIGVDDPGLSR